MPYHRDQPSFLEAFAPSAVMILFLVTGLACQYLLATRKRKQWPPTAADLNRKSFRLEDQDTSGTGHDVINDLLKQEDFMSSFDLEVLSELRHHTNNLPELMRISAPAVTSLLSAVLVVLSYQSLQPYLWPDVPRRPDVNTAITCYLGPAGLVYALSFGFLFQQALERQEFILSKLTAEISIIDHLITLAIRLTLPSQRHLMAICKAVKAEAVCMAMLVQGKEPESFHQAAPPNIKVQVWGILDILRDMTSQLDKSFCLNRILTVNILDDIIDVNNICSDRMGPLYTRIHLLTWVFLQALGIMTLFGVLLVDAQSKNLEIFIWNITIYSTSMLCYVLADLDSPFDGFFRVKLDVLHEVVERAGRVYAETRDEMGEGAGQVYAETRDEMGEGAGRVYAETRDEMGEGAGRVYAETRDEMGEGAGRVYVEARDEMGEGAGRVYAETRDEMGEGQADGVCRDPGRDGGGGRLMVYAETRDEMGEGAG